MAIAAFFPFCAHLLGRYPGNTLAIVIWLATVWCFAFGLLLLALAAERQGLFGPEFDAAQTRRLRNRLVRLTAILLVYVVCFGLLHPALMR
jgi:hypothetical protein